MLKVSPSVLLLLCLVALAAISVSTGTALYIIINTLAAGLKEYTGLGADGYELYGALAIEGLSVGTEVGSFVIMAICTFLDANVRNAEVVDPQTVETLEDLKWWKRTLLYAFGAFALVSIYFNVLHGHDYAVKHTEKLYYAVVAGNGVMPVLAYVGLAISMLFVKLTFILLNGMPKEEASAPQNTASEVQVGNDPKPQVRDSLPPANAPAVREVPMTPAAQANGGRRKAVVRK